MVETIVNSLKQNFLDNMIWDVTKILILSTVLIPLLSWGLSKFFGFRSPIEFIKGIIDAHKISKTLLDKSRPNRGGLPTHLADRFIEIWCSSERKGFHRLGDNSIQGFYKFLPGNIRHNTAYTVEKIDRILANEALIEIMQNNQLKPIRNRRNKLIYRKCKKYFIKYHGDDKKYYENLEKNIETFK